MRTMLPRSVSILGSHPLFGPDSFTGTLKGHRIILCPVRGPAALVQSARQALTKAGLSVTVMTSEAHDRMMAETVFLTQLVGRVLHMARLEGAEGWTVHYRHLQSIVAVARNDSEQLFLDMWRFNPHARIIVRRFRSGVTKLHRLLASPSP
jgi:prephenate dehydrogenase